MQPVKHCCLCQNNHLVPILDIGFQSLPGQFYRPDEMPPPSQPVVVARCVECGLWQQQYQLPPEAHFTKYWYRSSVSGTMRDHLTAVAEEACDMLVSRAEPPFPAHVLDIGGSDGWLLDSLPFATPHRTIVDPSDVPLELPDGTPVPGIKKIHGYFPECMEGMVSSYHLIFSIACFYSSPNPVGWAREVAAILSPDGLWCCEVASQYSVMQRHDLGYWCAEHVALYNAFQLDYVANLSELKIVRIEESHINGGSLRVYFAHRACNKYENPEWRARVEALIAHGRASVLDEELGNKWAANIVKNGHQLREWLAQKQDRGEVVHVLGASTKGGVLLQFVQAQMYGVRIASDRDPRKRGLLIPGTGIKVCSEEYSRSCQPSAYLCLIPFRDEVITRERDAGFKGQFAFPYPSLEVV